MSHLTFAYNNQNLSGLFNYVRSNALNTVKVISPESHITNQNSFCDRYIGEEGTAIIDGDTNTAWANKITTANNSYVIIDLGIGSFLLESFDYRTTCNPPSIFIVSGSNDNVEYNPICTIRDIHNLHSFHHRECLSYNKPYRYFELRQSTNFIDGTYRLHISEIEFYGVLNPYLKTCQNNGILLNNLIPYLCIGIFMHS